MSGPDVVVIGGGIGGLSASIVLAGKGRRVRLLERASRVGGKATTTQIDGVEVDTGPSVLTLPEIFDDVFEAAGMKREEQLSLTTPRPGFRYLYEDGVCLDIFHDLSETLQSVETALGRNAASQFEGYLRTAEKIWDAAAPHFVMARAPNVASLLFGGVGAWGAATKIDAFRTLGAAIDKQVQDEHLRALLKRYATYNGSDVRTAPATLGCIAHVELALGGYGVRGGMYELVRALLRAAEKVGVEIETNAEVERIVLKKGAGGVAGVALSGGRTLDCAHVVANAEAAHVGEKLLKSDARFPQLGDLSMSGHTGILRDRRREESRVAHTVLFPKVYEEEFADIFDHKRVPRDPTIYLCAQESCHERTGWETEEPVFAMINAPVFEETAPEEAVEAIQERVCERLRSRALLSEEGGVAWWRTPAGLAKQFPGSQGALYGAASNSAQSAFRRPPNRIKQIRGLYLASGSAHPGGGVPMVAQSGKQAALAVLES